MDHLSHDRLAAYLSESLPIEDSLECDEHLAICKSCAERVRALLSVKEDFDELWNTWTLSTHVAEFAAAQIGVFIGNAQMKDYLRTRAEQWSKTIQNGVEAALGLTVDASKRMAGIIQEGLDFLQPGINAKTFSLAPSPVVVEGDPESPSWIIAEAAGPPWTKVTADPVIGRVLVQMESLKGPWPLAALVAKDGSWAAVELFRKPEGESFLLAEFEDIPSGELLVIIEKSPMQALEGP